MEPEKTLVAKKRTDFKVDGQGKTPGFGTIGVPIKVFANHFPVTIPRKGTIFHYDIDIKDQSPRGRPATKPKANEKAAGDASEPSEAGAAGSGAAAAKIPKRLKREIIEAWQNQNKAFFDNGKILGVYDGEKNFFTCKKLTVKPGEARQCTINLPENKVERTRERSFVLTVKETAAPVLQLETLHTALSTQSSEFPTFILSALQCVMREALTRWCPVPGLRTFFFPEDAFDLGGDRGGWSPKMAWPGIFLSLRPELGTLALNLDVSHTALSKQQLVVDYYANYIWYNTKTFNQENGVDIYIPNARIPDQVRRAAEREVYGCKVETQHSGTRRWRCCGLSARPLYELEFTLADGTKQKVVDYFHTQYDITLQYTHLPAVLVGSRTAPKYLPMTLTTILEGQKMGRKLAEQEVATMVRACAKPVYERKQQIEAIRTQSIMTTGNTRKKPFEQTDNPYLREFGISVQAAMPLVDARVLPVPIVGGKDLCTVNAIDATVDGRSFLPKVGVALTDWAVLNLSVPPRLARDPRLHQEAMNKFLELLGKIGRERMGTFAQAKNADVAAEQADPRVTFQQIYRKMKQQLFQGRKPQLLMVIVPRKGCSEYAVCKQFFDVKEGVKTQMVAADSLCKNIELDPRTQADRLPMYVGNLLLKINAKLNGSNQMVALPRLPPEIKNLTGMKKLMSEPTMIFGADVTHPSPGASSNTPSIAAVVGSVDRCWAEYRARVRAQGHREEIIQDMEYFVRELSAEFRAKHNDIIPQHIVFFRDGVSEGQMSSVMVNEAVALQNACRAIDPKFNPGITYIIVGKRHHTRLFPQNKQNAAGNVRPGTIVDREICHYADFDYYLCSHFGIQGTSRPAHYQVLCDTNGLDVDTLQLLSYHLCYNYQRCTRAVSVPAPAYYAHHAAFRARHHLARVFTDNDSDSFAGLSADEKERQMQVLLAGYNEKIQLHDETRNTQYFC